MFTLIPHLKYLDGFDQDDVEADLSEEEDTGDDLDEEEDSDEDEAIDSNDEEALKYLNSSQALQVPSCCICLN
jgi:hypothetical protein